MVTVARPFIILLIFSPSCLSISLRFSHFFSLSYLCFFFPSLSLPIHSLLQWVWSTSSFLIHSLLVLFVGVDFNLNGSNQPWVSAWSRFRLRSTMRMRNKIITKLGSERFGLCLDGGQWWLQEFCLGGSLKIFNKKNLNISNYQQQKKKNLIHEVLQFSCTSFQILNCYMTVHYEYLLSMWVVMRLWLCYFVKFI